MLDHGVLSGEKKVNLTFCASGKRGDGLEASVVRSLCGKDCA